MSENRAARAPLGARATILVLLLASDDEALKGMRSKIRASRDWPEPTSGGVRGQRDRNGAAEQDRGGG